MPPLIVTDSNYEFTPPHHGRLWPRLLARLAVRLTKKKYGITEVEIRHQQRLAELINQGHGILLAPNHCRMSDAMVLQSLSHSLRQPFYIMASSHLFRHGLWMRWLLRRMGAFSVYREGVDRKAVETAIEMLVQARRPLVVFPEGALSQANDRLNALMEGVSFMARTAARKLEKQSGDSVPQKKIFLFPVAIRYLFQGDVDTTVNPMLEDVERRLIWRPQNDRPLVERIYRIANALLGLKETEFLGAPCSGDISDRLQRLINEILWPLEDEWLKVRSDGSTVNRVKDLRKVIVPGMIQAPEENAAAPTALPKNELDRRWKQLEDMDLAQALSLFPRDYIAANPTADRILETVERITENLSGEEQAHGPMKAVIHVGEPIVVAGKRDRRADGDPVLAELEARLTALLQELSQESRPASRNHAND